MNDFLEIENSELVELCKAGDKEAMNLLYTRFAPRMLALIQRFVDEPADAQDILHDGFVIAFTRLDTLRDTERVDYWLATIMRNLAISFLKSRDLTQILHDLPDVEDKKSVENVVDFDVLLSLINELPKGYQNVFRLAVLENKSHKEIAEILGIAPHSASSQLFRAKLQMRALIKNYRRNAGIFVLLLLLAAPGVWYMMRNIDREETAIALHHSDSSKISSHHKKSSNTVASISSFFKKGRARGGNVPTRVHTVAPNIPLLFTGKRDSTITAQSASSIEETNLALASDTIGRSASQPSDSLGKREKTLPDYYDYYADQTQYPITNINPTSGNGWNLAFSVVPGAGGIGAIGMGDASYNHPGGNDPNNPEPSDPNNPQGPNVDFDPDKDNPDNGEEKDDMDNFENESRNKAKSQIRKSPSKSFKDTPHTNHLPISFVVTAQKNLTGWLGLETGLTYTYLHTSFDAPTWKAEAHWHYLGIPVKLNLTAWSSPKFRIYGAIGGSVSFPLYSFANYKPWVNGMKTERFSSYPVWSIGAGIGGSFSISNQIDLYIEPTLQYHFNHKYEVPNYWTDERWGISIPIGIRFKW